jgi:hypothetical protein
MRKSIFSGLALIVTLSQPFYSLPALANWGDLKQTHCTSGIHSTEIMAKLEAKKCAKAVCRGDNGQVVFGSASTVSCLHNKGGYQCTGVVSCRVPASLASPAIPTPGTAYCK